MMGQLLRMAAAANGRPSYIPIPNATPATFGDAFEGGFYTGMIWNELVQSTTSTTIATGTQTFAVPDMSATPIVYKGQSLEVRSRANPANKMIATVASAIGTSLTLTVSSVSGAGTFSDWSVMAKYRCIVSPKSTEIASVALKNANTALPVACQTLSEGYSATQAMVAAGDATTYPAAHQVAAIAAGGYTDWYIPARDELELCWRNLKPTTDSNRTTRDTTATYDYRNRGSFADANPAANSENLNSAPQGAAYTTSNPAQTPVTAFKTGGSEAFAYGSSYYRSSSDGNTASAWIQAWNTNSGIQGAQLVSGKTNLFVVRAMRRSII